MHQHNTTSQTNRTSDDIIGGDIFSLLGLESTSHEERTQLFALMQKTIQDRILARLLDHCTEEEQKKLDQLFSKKKTKEVNAFLKRKNLSPIQTLVAQEAILYKLELVSHLKKETED